FDGRPRTEAARRARGSYRPEFLAAIDWAMAFDPTDRPQSVAEWRAKLFSQTRIVSQPQEHSRAEQRFTLRPPASFPWKTAAAATAVICVVAALATLWPCQLLGSRCRGPDGAAIALEIAVPKQSYAIGDNLTFKVRSNRDCYFMVYTVSPTGDVE